MQSPQHYTGLIYSLFYLKLLKLRAEKLSFSSQTIFDSLQLLVPSMLHEHYALRWETDNLAQDVFKGKKGKLMSTVVQTEGLGLVYWL